MWTTFLQTYILFASSIFCSAHAIGKAPLTHGLRTESGFHLPIYKGKSSLRRRGQTAAIGLGDYVDVTYNVLVNIGGVASPVVLDTGSSDLWVISDACITCSKAVQQYPQATFNSVGLDVALLYGDSQTGTHANGLIGDDTVNLAGLTLPKQFFAAINDTNTSVEDTGSAGIFGLGFPVNSVIWTDLIIQERDTGVQFSKRELPSTDLGRPAFLNVSKLFDTVTSHFRRSKFPTVADLYPGLKSKHNTRQATSDTASLSKLIADSYTRTAPLLSRLVAMNALSLPQFTVSLQRDTVEVGGNDGMLSIGELPSGVSNNSLTWVPLRGYTVDENGLPAPPDSPNEVYPISWEVFLDDVYLDGNKLPRSSLSPSTIALSTLVDTGNSLIRGPSDVVSTINFQLGGTFPCNEPHTLAFQIGGKMFPVDPRDFITQVNLDDVDSCTANLAATDPPQEGQFLYSWSLGDPFLKRYALRCRFTSTRLSLNAFSVIASFHYGNLTYPSVDPPSMGFLSTVPPDAGDKLKAAVAAAKANGNNFPTLSEQAPTGVRTSVPSVTSTITSSKSTSSKSNAASRIETKTWGMLTASLLVVFGAASTM
ncbi:hypothetical protein C0995_011970 [Termitomyces sp. Mi166|nr:hypothetical protein C0995_011970 [Termitomyces sp. Mi166\